MRDELLNGEIFDTLLEAKVLIERWRKEYNTIRQHSSLDVATGTGGYIVLFAFFRYTPSVKQNNPSYNRTLSLVTGVIHGGQINPDANDQSVLDLLSDSKINVGSNILDEPDR